MEGNDEEEIVMNWGLIVVILAAAFVGEQIGEQIHHNRVTRRLNRLFESGEFEAIMRRHGLIDDNTGKWKHEGTAKIFSDLSNN